MVYKKIKIGAKKIEALEMKLQDKTLVILRGSAGYVMCGYLNLKAANKFKDAAIKITGVVNINDALKAKVHSCSNLAKKLGVYPGQPIKEVLKLIA